MADLGERFLELERGLDAVILQNSFEPQRFGGSVDLSRLYGYIERSSSYTACLLEEQRRQFEEERRRDRAQATTGGRARDRVSGLGLPDVAHGSACTPP